MKIVIAVNVPAIEFNAKLDVANTAKPIQRTNVVIIKASPTLSKA